MAMKVLQVMTNLMRPNSARAGSTVRELFLSEDGERVPVFLYVGMDAESKQPVGLIVRNSVPEPELETAAIAGSSASAASASIATAETQDQKQNDHANATLNLTLVWRRYLTQHRLLDALAAFMCDFPRAMFSTTGGRCVQFQNKQAATTFAATTCVPASLYGMQWLAKSGWTQIGVWIPEEGAAANEATTSSADASDPDNYQVILLDLLKQQVIGTAS